MGSCRNVKPAAFDSKIAELRAAQSLETLTSIPLQLHLSKPSSGYQDAPQSEAHGETREGTASDSEIAESLAALLEDDLSSVLNPLPFTAPLSEDQDPPCPKTLDGGRKWTSADVKRHRVSIRVAANKLYAELSSDPNTDPAVLQFADLCDRLESDAIDRYEFIHFSRKLISGYPHIIAWLEDWSGVLVAEEDAEEDEDDLPFPDSLAFFQHVQTYFEEDPFLYAVFVQLCEDFASTAIDSFTLLHRANDFFIGNRPELFEWLRDYIMHDVPHTASLTTATLPAMSSLLPLPWMVPSKVDLTSLVPDPSRLITREKWARRLFGPPTRSSTRLKEVLVRKMMEPMRSTLLKLSGATKENIPKKDARLRTIRIGVVAIGDHISTEVQSSSQHSLADKLELWDYVSEHHWPQSTSNSEHMSGQKLRDMYERITGKDKVSAASAKAGVSKPAAVGMDSAANEVDVHVTHSKISQKGKQTRRESKLGYRRQHRSLALRPAKGKDA